METNNISTPSTADFGLQWGNRKRLRCMKIQGKNETSTTVSRTTVRVDRRVIRTDDSNNGNDSNNGHFNLRQRLGSPAQLPARALSNRRVSNGRRRVSHGNTESGSSMKGHNNNNHQSNGGGKRGLASPDRAEKKGGTHHNHDNGGVAGRATSSETKNGSSSGGGSDVVWPPKFMITLTNKEKEEDFMAIKGSKLPHRPKKRAKFIQRTLNLVSPGGWLCDLTLERYEVREKKISKKRPRGLKAMSNYMDSDSE